MDQLAVRMVLTLERELDLFGPAIPVGTLVRDPNSRDSRLWVRKGNLERKRLIIGRDACANTLPGLRLRTGYGVSKEGLGRLASRFELSCDLHPLQPVRLITDVVLESALVCAAPITIVSCHAEALSIFSEKARHTNVCLTIRRVKKF